MAGNSSDRVFRQVHRVLNFGAVGTMPDAQLLEWFVTEPAESAEAAFEELMNRHGPMVFGVCRRVLQDPHDAEDAYQAVFLVLAKRAGSIRRKHSAASWLFGVAHRVAVRARGRAARRRAIELRIAEQTAEGFLPSGEQTDWSMLHDEVDRLPERLRAPLVLCYLEGLTYGAAAQQLGLSEGTLRGRLAQARKRLHRQLNWRGVSVAAVPLNSGLPVLSVSPVPQSLVVSTVRLALGSTSVNTATVLAREVMKVMLLNQLRIAGVVVLIASACVTAGLAWAVGPKPAAQPPAAAAPPVAAAAATTTLSDKPAPGRRVELRGVVVDEDGRPVAGAEVRVDPFTDREASGSTGPDGSFSIPVQHRLFGYPALLARSASGEKFGFSPNEFNRKPANAIEPARLVVKPAREVVVRVTDVSKAPVSGAAVEAAGNFAVVDSETTGPDGSVTLHIPADAKVEWIVALKSGRGFDYAEFGPFDQYGRTKGGAPAAEVPASVALNLDGARTARIKAVDRDGKPLAGVGFSSWLLKKDGRRSHVNFFEPVLDAKSGVDGIATFDWLPVNNDDLMFFPISEAYANRRVIVKYGENRPVTATMTRTETIRGRVVGPDGTPVAGIEIRAFGTGQGMDHGQADARTAADGTYEMSVNSGEAYAVYVDDKDWAAPSRLDVVVHEGKPVDRVDFRLSRGTVIHGTVTIGAANRPAADQFIRLDEAGGSAPDDLRQKGDRFVRDIRRQFGATTDSSGRYSIRVGPGTYTIMGPPRTRDEKITVTNEAEIVRDFQMPRPEKGTITGRVVFASAAEKGVAGARVEIVAANRFGVPFTVTADANGRFQSERDLDPLVILRRKR